MFILHLLPSTRGVRFTGMAIDGEYILLQLRTTAPSAGCPRCAVPSSSAHSRYQRCWGTCPVRLQLTVRTFVCRNPSGRRRIFTERVPALAAYARRTQRLATVLQAIGVALGGQAGARLA
jgi:hypothetical protein